MTIINADVIIVGGGITGLLLTKILASNDVSVVLIEKSKIEQENQDTRTLAISPKTAKTLTSIGIWQKLQDNIGKINDIYITSDLGFIHYERKNNSDEPIGYTIPYSLLKKTLAEDVIKLKNITILDNNSYKDIQINATSVVLETNCEKKIIAPLLICAEGAQSRMINSMNFKTSSFDYNQMCITFIFEHTQPNYNIAIEHFEKKYSFALLPTINQYLSSFILLVDKKISIDTYNYSKEEMIQLLNKKIPISLGKAKEVYPRMQYPLKRKYSTPYHKERFVLAGDSAHSVHPVTGQGFNMTANDADVLCEIIIDSLSKGIDIGSNDVLERFYKKRKINNLAIIHYTDKIIRSFTQGIPFTSFVMSMGFNLINKSNFMKRKIIQYFNNDY